MIGTNTMKSLKMFFLILKNLELNKVQFEILQKMEKPYKNWFSENLNVSMNEIVQFLNLISIPKFIENPSADCEFLMSETDLTPVLKSMPYNKSPGKDDLGKELCDVFWEDLRTPIISNFKSAFNKGELSHSQKQAVIRLIGKKDRDKRLIQNSRPFFLLTVDLRILSKALADCIKKYLSSIIL